MDSTAEMAQTQAIIPRSPQPLPSREIKDRISSFARPYKELMTYYHCAMLEVETKFKVLNSEFSLEYDRNPIETIKTRLKSTESIFNKLTSMEIEINAENIEKNLHDIAGVRVICGFPSDIYMLADAFLRQDDITLVEKKDYMANPKPNGYRSLHLIVEIPIFLHDEKKPMKVEVQLRTISMDWWASLEHKLRYKKDVEISGDIHQELMECAEAAALLDRRMEQIQKKIGARLHGL